MAAEEVEATETEQRYMQLAEYMQKMQAGEHVGIKKRVHYDKLLRETLSKLNEKDDTVGLSSLELKIQKAIDKHYTEKENKRKMKERQMEEMKKRENDPNAPKVQYV